MKGFNLLFFSEWTNDHLLWNGVCLEEEKHQLTQRIGSSFILSPRKEYLVLI
jgi:hypothetical protein